MLKIIGKWIFFPAEWVKVLPRKRFFNFFDSNIKTVGHISPFPVAALAYPFALCYFGPICTYKVNRGHLLSS